MSNKSQPTGSAKDMLSAKLKGLPFKDEQMNVFFVSLTGATVFSGATIGESYYAVSKIKDGDVNSWIAAFGEVAGNAEKQAREFLAQGCKESARYAFLRASHYYYGADHYAGKEHPKYMEYWQHSVACFRQAAALSNPQIEPLKYELDGQQLDAYFVPAQGPARGTLLVMSGFDGTPEHLYFACGAGLSQRGYNTLLFEGPGQRGMSHRTTDLPFRTNYETVVSKVVDLALSRPEVDPERLGLVGYSFGGHLALRAAAYEPRLKALIANPPVMDFGKQMIDGFPAFARWSNDNLVNWMMANSIGFMPQALQSSLKRLYEAMNVTQFSDFRRAMKQFRFTDIERITCPVLCLVSEGEGASAIEDARQVFQRLPHPQKKMVYFSSEQGANVHCQLNNLGLSIHAMADWLDGLWPC